VRDAYDFSDDETIRREVADFLANDPAVPPEERVKWGNKP
jgi:hypothetical protein